MADTIVLPMAEDLLSCLQEQLELNPDPPANSCLLAGNLTLHDANAETGVDKVCCPGTSYVRIGQMYPSSTFPEPDLVVARGQEGCFPVAWAVELVLGVVRCVPGMGTVAGPSCADWLTAATHDANDLDAIRKALCCWAGTIPARRRWLAQTATVELAADCIERSMPILVSVPKCC